MTKGRILGIVWLVVIVLTAWWVYKSFKPGFMKG